MAVVYLGVGANLGDRHKTFDDARAHLCARGVPIQREATRRTTAPVGPQNQDPFLNTVFLGTTKLDPRALLMTLKIIERDLGRTPSERWGPRVIDLDILLYGDSIVAESDLVIPHPELVRRRFVLEPLLELTPNLVIPKDGRTVAQILAAL